MEALPYYAHAVMFCFIYLSVGKTCAESLGIVESVEIDFRLRMIMGRIAGPFSGIAEDLSEHHVGKRRIIIVEEGFDLPFNASAQLTIGAGVLYDYIFRRKEYSTDSTTEDSGRVLNEQRMSLNRLTITVFSSGGFQKGIM